MFKLSAALGGKRTPAMISNLVTIRGYVRAMQILAQVLLDLLLLRRTDSSVEGSSTGLQMTALAMFGISGTLLLGALVAMYH